DVASELEQRSALSADDVRSVGETERLALERADPKPSQNGSGNDGILLEDALGLRVGDSRRLDAIVEEQSRSGKSV
ncbi:MAG: hypothetical protein AABZ83_07730, partial [candidate division NC10 bacterium]